MTTRTPNRTASTGVFYTGSPDYVDVSSATAESGMVSFEDRAVADSWADGDSVVVVVYVDDDNYKVCPATWDETNSYLLLGTAEESVGTIANSTAVVVTATLSNALLEAGLVSNYPDLLGLDQDGDSRGINTVNLQSGRWSDANVASGEQGVVVGHNTKASGISATALGINAVASGIASIAIRGRAYGDLSFSFGSEAFADQSICSVGYFAIPIDDWDDQYESYSAGTQAVFATPPVDLGVPPDWAASTTYAHGEIVQPTTGGTVQYRAITEYNDTTFIQDTPSSDTTEPTWPGDGGDVDLDAAGEAYWVGIDLDSGYETETFPYWLEFYPTSIAFICQDYSSTTGTPTISVGTPSNPTLILNAASVGVTAEGQTYQFTLPNPCPRVPEGESLFVTLDSAASAGVMAGRFVFTGVFMATRSRT